MVISADIFAVLLRYLESSVGNLIISDFNQKHSRPVLFERDFKLSNCSCKVNFTN